MRDFRVDTDEPLRELIDKVNAEEVKTGLRWRYLLTGNCTHALRQGDRVAVAECGVGGWMSEWLGTGGQGEYERAATLPRCRRCVRKTT